MELGTCMCIGLNIQRSEACIADPNLLQIKQVIPTFMSAEAFQDQAIYHLQANPNAHGAFTGSQNA
jgi:hypothetical protein